MSNSGKTPIEQPTTTNNLPQPPAYPVIQYAQGIPPQNSNVVIQIAQDKFKTEEARYNAIRWSVIALLCGQIWCLCLSLPAFVTALKPDHHIETYRNAKKKAIIAFSICFAICLAVFCWELRNMEHQFPFPYTHL